MPPTRRQGPRRAAAAARGLIRLRLQLGPVGPMPAGPGAWVTAEDRAAWLVIAAEVPPAKWPTWEAFWASAPGIPDDLRLLPGFHALGVDQTSRRPPGCAITAERSGHEPPTGPADPCRAARRWRRAPDDPVSM